MYQNVVMEGCYVLSLGYFNVFEVYGAECHGRGCHVCAPETMAHSI